MLQYYKLVLVRAGANNRLFKRELRRALNELKNPDDIESLKEWFKHNAAQYKAL